MVEIVTRMKAEDMRTAVHAELRALPPPVDLRERRSRLRLLDWLRRPVRLFDRLAGPVHVTGSAIVVWPPGVVLHLHQRMGMWLQPGGHLEPGEPPWLAAARETAEETGLRAAWPARPPLVHVDVHPGPHGHLHLDLRYLLRVPGDSPRPAAGESQDGRWVSWPEALAVADVGLVGALRAIQGPRRIGARFER
jgi:8-oxo-dGTP pyrophosphatase MutT (NUDIX family)